MDNGWMDDINLEKKSDIPWKVLLIDFGSLLCCMWKSCQCLFSLFTCVTDPV